ncbi:MAG: DNA translocase FtsK 4TM domain-containing protein [Candidatus Kapaibacterium sp.]
MERSHELSAEDIALVRAASGSKEHSPQRVKSNADSSRKRVTRSGKTSGKVNGAKGKVAAQTESKEIQEERLTQVIAVLLGLCSVLLFLALISYSRLDQANTDVGVSQLTGLLTNDPDIAARADTTENWLGLIGAFLANFFLNGTIGWFALIFPGIFGLWSYSVFSKKDLALVMNRSLFALLLGLLAASLVGTIREISWLPQIAYECTGAVGAFMASILTGLIGTVGGVLLLVAAITVTLLYAFNADLRQVISKIRYATNIAWTKVAGTAQRIREATDGDNQRAESEGKVQAKAGRANQSNDREIGDEEPARMIRRFKETEQAVPPSIQRQHSENVASRQKETPAPIRRENPIIQPPTQQIDKTEISDKNEVGRSTPPSPLDQGTHVAEDSIENREESRIQSREQEGVTLTRAPAEEPAEMVMPKLTVHVEEGETDADLEMSEAGKLIERLKDEQIKYDPPQIELLAPQEVHEEVEDNELKTHARLLQEKLRTFNIEIENLTVTPGPVVTLFEFVPAAGIKLSQIESLGDDIALALKARGIRIIAPIPGKGTVGVEIPNTHPATVRIRSVLNTTKFREADLRLPLALGKTTVGEVFCADLTKMPHLLIAGATGAGKSVGINSILASLLYKMHPSELKLAIIDPKKIELTQYRALANHYLVCCPDIDEDIVTDPQNAVLLLKSLELEMDRRYDMLAKSGQRNIFDYNKKIDDGALKPTPEAPHVKLPFIVLIIDELADLMITASKEVEEPIARLAQLARAIGIHMIVATQRPSVDVLTGMIKANFPARIAYQVATKVDSRTILDVNGAEQLLGNGDMLYLPGGRPKPLRLQNAFITTEEVEAICEHIGSQKGYSNPYTLPSLAEKKKTSSGGTSDERDDLFDEAAHLVVRHQQGSVSLLQRRLKVGYARAARIVDELEDAGIVGPFDGSKAREVLLESEAELEAFL